MKVCLVSTVGGHLAQLEAIAPAAEGHDCYLVTVLSPHAAYALPGIRRYFVRQVLRNPVNFLLNFVKSLWILLKERPQVIITTGAGDALPTVFLGAALGSMVVFVESLARVRAPSLFGRIVHRWCDTILIQWPELSRAYPRGIRVAPVFRLQATATPIGRNPSILALTGTHTRGFERLLRSVDRQISDGSLSGNVVFQIGHSTFEPRNGPWFRFVPHDELLTRIRAADLVVTHDGSASIAEALSCGKPTLVVPRRSEDAEVSYDSGQVLARHLAAMGVVTLLEDPDRVAGAIQEMHGRLPPVIAFPGADAIDTLRRLLSTAEQRPRAGAGLLPVPPENLAAPSVELQGTRVVVVSPVNPREPWASGVRTYVEALVANLAAAGLAVTLVTTGQEGDESSANVRTILLMDRRPSTFRFLAQLAIAGPIVRSTGEIVHLQRLDHVLPLVPWLRSRSVVVTLHGNVPRSIALRRGRFIARLAEVAEGLASFFVDGLVAVDDRTRQGYEERFPWLRGRIQVIPNGFWSAELLSKESAREPLDGLPLDARIVLFAGRLVPEKNLTLLLESFAEVLHRLPDTFLVVVGDGPEAAALRARGQSMGLTRFVLLPTLERLQLFGLIRRAAVVAVPSFMEGDPFIALEAICLGTPVVATPVGRLGEIIAQWDVGVVARSDRQSFASGLVRILERGKADYRRNCGMAARALSFEATFRETAALYTRVKATRGE